MKLNQQLSNDVNLIKKVDDNSIAINEKTYDESCIVSRNSIISDLNVRSIEELRLDHIQQLLSSKPDVIILGSGLDHAFPDVKLLEPIAIQDIGFEVMNNKSAARTYNILLAEERKVACLLIIG